LLQGLAHGFVWFLFFKVFGFGFFCITNEYSFFESLIFFFSTLLFWLRDALFSYRGCFGCDVLLRILVCYLVFVFVDNNKCGCQCNSAWHVNMCVVFCAIIPRNLGTKNQYFCAIEKVPEAILNSEVWLETNGFFQQIFFFLGGETNFIFFLL
jgi:hypothetical protein